MAAQIAAYHIINVQCLDYLMMFPSAVKDVRMFKYMSASLSVRSWTFVVFARLVLTPLSLRVTRRFVKTPTGVRFAACD